MFTDHSTLMIFKFKTISLREFNHCTEANSLVDEGWRVLEFTPALNAITVLLYSCPNGRNHDRDQDEHAQAKRAWVTKSSHPLLTS